MAYTSRSNRPNEFANKSNHTYIIKDAIIQDFLGRCLIPNKENDEDAENNNLLLEIEEPKKNPIKYVIAIDGGYTLIEVQKNYPTSTIAFFQFGAFILNLEDWKNLSNQPFISPEDMSTFNNLERIKLVLPTKLVNLKSEKRFTDSVRKAIYEFFMLKRDGSSLMETLKWFFFEEYQKNYQDDKEYPLTNPNVDSFETESILLKKEDLLKDFTFLINNQVVYLTDVFEFHRKIDDEQGGEAILGNLSTLIEQIILVDYIRQVLKHKPSMLNEILFIKDGSLAFFDVTFRLRIKMRKLMCFLQEEHNLFLVGLEKSGAFADHAFFISSEQEKDGKIITKLPRGMCLLLDNSYIYKYITPGDSNKMTYGKNIYYSGKVIFKAKNGNNFVANLPMSVIEDNEYEMVIKNPERKSYKNLDIILYNLSQLKCEMYDNALIPITLANKLVSLANHPSQKILETFAKDAIRS